MAEQEMFSPENMVANNVIGRAEEVVQRLKSYQALGYDEYSFWIDSGMTHAQKKKSLSLFIDNVMPAFA